MTLYVAATRGARYAHQEKQCYALRRALSVEPIKPQKVAERGLQVHECRHSHPNYKLPNPKASTRRGHYRTQLVQAVEKVLIQAVAPVTTRGIAAALDRIRPDHKVAASIYAVLSRMERCGRVVQVVHGEPGGQAAQWVLGGRADPQAHGNARMRAQEGLATPSYDAAPRRQAIEVSSRQTREATRPGRIAGEQAKASEGCVLRGDEPVDAERGA